MHVMPFANSAISSHNTNSSIIPQQQQQQQQQQQHPHPLRSHNSSADILAERLCSSYITQHEPHTPTTNSISRTRCSCSSLSSSSSSSRYHHRRSSTRTSIDISEFQQVQDASSPFARSPTRLRDDSYKRPSTASGVVNFSFPISSLPRDYPIVPVRPPLRPTVSFGTISHHSYDSSSPIVESSAPEASMMLYEKRASMESREVKPAWNRKVHDCFSCCFGGHSSP